MKSLEWNGPSLKQKGEIRGERAAMSEREFRANISMARKQVEKESLSESMDRLHHEKHTKFRRWQDAITMNIIFGDNYVTVPEIPKGYEDYAKWWYDNELKAFK